MASSRQTVDEMLLITESLNIQAKRKFLKTPLHEYLVEKHLHRQLTFVNSTKFTVKLLVLSFTKKSHHKTNFWHGGTYHCSRQHILKEYYQFFITKEKNILQNRYLFFIVVGLLQSYVLKAWNATGDSHQIPL